MALSHILVKRPMTERDYHTNAFDIFNVYVYILIFHIVGFLKDTLSPAICRYEMNIFRHCKILNIFTREQHITRRRLPQTRMCHYCT